MLAGGNVDQTEGVVAALYREAEDATTTSATCRLMGAMLSTAPGEAADDSGVDTGVSLEGYCHFLRHNYLFSPAFDHSKAASVFKQISQEELKGGAQAATYDEQGNAILTRQGFRLVLEHISRLRREQKTGGAARAGARDTRDALHELIKDIHLRREGPMEVDASDVQGPIYCEEVIEAVYAYKAPLMKLFSHYSDDTSAVSCRSAYRLCQATGLVPDHVVPAEFADLVASFSGKGGSKKTSGSSTERAERQAERRYLETSQCLAGGERQEWTKPALGELQPGEPRYETVAFFELLAAIALHAPPRPYAEIGEVRAERIHEVFGGLVGLPLRGQEDFEPKAFLQALHSGLATARLHASDRLAAALVDADRAAPTDLATVLIGLDQELPMLCGRKQPHVAQPPPPPLPTPPYLVAGAGAERAGEPGEKRAGKPDVAAPPKKLPMQPPTVEERVERLERKREEERKVAAAAAKARAKGKKPRAKAKAKAKVAPAPDPKPLTEQKGVVFDTPRFYAKRPDKPPPDRLPMRLREQRLSHQLELDDMRLLRKREEQRGQSTAAQGWVLRMTLIDEPVRAPRCPRSEEVSTLMETALASRRLRHYDEAIMLLIRARRRWAALEAGGEDADEWAGVQALNPAPSPWGRPAWAVATERNQQRFNIRPSTARSAPTPSPAPAERARAPPVAPETPPPAQSPAPARRAVVLGEEEEEGGHGHGAELLDDTILPSELRRDGAASRMSDARPASASRMSARGPSRAGTRKPAADGEPADRRYRPQTDFRFALGEGEPHLGRLPPEALLFFYAELASLHAAVHGEDFAAQLLWRACAESERLPKSHPDTAVVWCAFGRLAFLAGAYEVAARATLRARWIREKTLGGDTIETATAYNNLACCLSALDRPQEAEAYLELAAEILKVLAGEDHPRCQTALRNLEKARTAKRQLHLEVPHIFSYAVRSGYAKPKEAKKGKKGGGSRASSAGSEKSGKSNGSKKGKKK